jgi:hypothetical protein
LVKRFSCGAACDIPADSTGADTVIPGLFPLTACLG